MMKDTNGKTRLAFNLLYGKIPYHMRPSYKVFCNTNFSNYKLNWKKNKDLSEFMIYLNALSSYGYSFNNRDCVIHVLWTAFKRWRLEHNMNDIRKASYYCINNVKRDYKLQHWIYHSWLDNHINIEGTIGFELCG